MFSIGFRKRRSQSIVENASGRMIGSVASEVLFR